MINMTCLLYKASGQTNLIFLSCRFHMSNFIIVIKMNEDMNLFGLYNINPCNMIGRFSVRIARFIRSKILLLFVCVFMLPAIQRCVSPGHDLEPGQELSGEDWPQWRGPSSNGVSSEANLPARWSTDSNIVWKVALAGLGGSSPIVLGNRVFVTSQVGTATIRGGSHPQLARDDPSLVVQENPMGGRRSEPGEDDSEVLLVVEAFNLSNGKKLWDYRARAAGPLPELHEYHNLATPTPVSDGEHVYALFGNGLIVCLDMDGNLVWSRHLGREYSPFDIQWGHGSSPVLYNDKVILLCDHERASYLLALDKMTGEEQWKKDRGKGKVSFSTPVVVPGPEGDELVINSSERIDAYNPADGELLWYIGSERQSPIPTPVFHDSVIYMSRGYRNSDFLAILPGGRGEVTESHTLWRTPSGASYVPSIIYYDGLLYMTSDAGILTCADAGTGKQVWRQRLRGVFFASPAAGDGKVYLVSETGETIVVQAGREPKILSRNDLGERLIASAAISGGHIFLRSDENLFCIGK